MVSVNHDACTGCGSATRIYVERSCANCGRVSLHDIEDSEAFVQATINKGRLLLTPERRDELVSEGIRILIGLARDYQPGRGGLNAEGSRFSGYAAKYLPGKLSDAWHRLQEHKLQTNEDGSRSWAINPPAVSLEAIAEERPGGLDTERALHHYDNWEPEIITELPRLLTDHREEEDRLIESFCQMRVENYGLREFAKREGVSLFRAKDIERVSAYLYVKLQHAAEQALASAA